MTMFEITQYIDGKIAEVFYREFLSELTAESWCAYYSEDQIEYKITDSSYLE